MNWIPTYSDGITLMFLLVALLYLRELASNVKIKGVLRAALRRADSYGNSGRDTVRIDRNQAAELLGEPVIPRLGEKFNGKPDNVHPMARSPWCRRNLRKGA